MGFYAFSFKDDDLGSLLKRGKMVEYVEDIEREKMETSRKVAVINSFVWDKIVRRTAEYSGRVKKLENEMKNVKADNEILRRRLNRCECYVENQKQYTRRNQQRQDLNQLLSDIQKTIQRRNVLLFVYICV